MRLKNVNEGCEREPRVWRYHRWDSFTCAKMKEGIVVGCLLKVSAMASDDEGFLSVTSKLREFMALGYPAHVLNGVYCKTLTQTNQKSKKTDKCIVSGYRPKAGVVDQGTTNLDFPVKRDVEKHIFQTRAPAPLAASADRLAQPSTSSLLADDGSPAAAEHADLARRAYTGALAAALAGWAYFAVATVAPSAPAARLPQLLALAAPMGVVWASYDAMINAARIGRRRLRLPTYRRLNLGLAASHAWAAVAVAAAPTSPAAAAVQASLLGGCALVCTYVWLWTLSSRTLSRECPADVVGDYPDECASLDDPEAWPFFHANEYAALCLAFAALAALAALAPSPLCAAPLCAAPLAACRASAPWLWLVAVNLFVLKDGAEHGRPWRRLFHPSLRTLRSPPTFALVGWLWMKRFWRLRRGVALLSGLRLAAAAAAAAVGRPAGWRAADGVCVAVFLVAAKAVRRTPSQGGQLF
ncbi:hypothetical protein EMIHUDRAFT_453756, partial [Emiliania huxleyi CCMP1516]|uniref:Uncharacterized protein n=2 Tax=Emiliania huxleyi TaxID=2903 RepID=A0A0D3I0N1_EMIH1